MLNLAGTERLYHNRLTDLPKRIQQDVKTKLGLQQADTEHEGAMKIEALVAQHPWPADVSEHVKVLVSQFVRQAFINSGGARYRPAFAAESVLIEDFPEDQEPPKDAPLLAALGLGRRRGLARDEIEVALLAHGARILADELGLDPHECRLVCVPPDVYSRFGRDHGWGAQPQWTHFDGYQVMKGGCAVSRISGVLIRAPERFVNPLPSPNRELVLMSRRDNTE
jgi:hypothetical protein